MMAPFLKAFPKLFKTRKPRNSIATLLSYSTSSLASTSTSSSSSSSVPPASSPFPSPPSPSPSEGFGQLSSSLPIMERRVEAANTPARGALRREQTASLRHLHKLLLQDLQSMVGQERANAIYTNHVYRSKYLLVYGDEEREAALAEKLKRVLEEEGQAVEGPWCIRGGDLILEAWQRLSSRAAAVVVLVSPALFQDLDLCRCLAEMQYSHPDTIAPLFLDSYSPRNLPADLTFLSHAGGRSVPQSHWDPQSFVKSLVERCQHLRYFCREIAILNSILDSLKENADYVCPCGRC